MRTPLSSALCLALISSACTREPEQKPVTRADQVAKVRGLLQAKKPTEALAAIDQSFPSDKSPEIGELRAQAHDAALTACTTDGCRFAEGVAASAANASPARAAQVTTQRARLLDALNPDQVTEKELAPRLKLVGALASNAAVATELAPSDSELQERAKKALAFADVERAKVPLLKADMPVVEALLGPLKLNAQNVPMIELDGVTAYFNVDQSGKCAGVYAVGSFGTSHVYKSSSWPPTRLLSQALGHTSTLRLPSAGAATIAWRDGVPILLRYRAGDLVEMRIGEATP
jgi:hypothetical protein